MPPYQYIILHKDISQRGVAAVQAAHAAAESIRTLPVDPETYVVVLRGSSDDMERIAARLKIASIHHVLIREPDEPYKGAAVALGIEPLPRETIWAYTVDFKVFR